LNDKKEKVVKKWFLMSGEDLKVADLIFKSKHYPQALYYLQQSNEKLVKALLLWIGILTPKRTREDWKIKSLLGFFPKQPASYGHRTTRPLFSDLQKMVPTIQELFTLLKNNGLDEKIAEFQNTIKKSKKGIYKLKKRPSNLIRESDQLEKEINATKAVLDAFDNIIIKVDQDIDKLDFQEIIRSAMNIVAREGITTNIEPPTFGEIKKAVLLNLKVSVLIAISVSVALLLDPLVSITRYPDSRHAPFDENNPYITQFEDLRDLVMSCHKKVAEALDLEVIDD